MEIKEIQEQDYHYLVDWNKRKNQDFLQQWAGPIAYFYPISERQIAARIDDGAHIYIVQQDEKVIGSFELDINLGKKQAFLSRVLFDEVIHGQGLGTKALSLMANNVFEKYPIHKIILHVYCFNTGAIRCYQKVGFRITATNETEDGKWNSYTMECQKNAH